MKYYWVIEVATRGVFMEFHHNPKGDWVPRFSWNCLRSDGYHFLTEDSAKRKLVEIQKTAPKAYIYKMPGR